MENQILKDIHFNSGKGGLFYKEVRYLLIRPETLVTFQKAIEKELGEKASQILYRSGFQGELSLQKDIEKPLEFQMNKSFTS